MNGTLELAFDNSGVAGATRLAHLHQTAPLRALFPETCRMDLPVVALTATCGGFTGGDQLRTAIGMGAGTKAMAIASEYERARTDFQESQRQAMVLRWALYRNAEMDAPAWTLIRTEG